MNVRRYETRYRPGRSLSVLGPLLRQTDLDSLSTNNEPDTVADWLPAVDIREEEERFVLQADLPGVDPDDIDVTMADGVLTIQGSRQPENTDKTENYSRYERVSGRFLRRFTLPDTANGDEIAAKTRHGVLEISIPKQVRQQARKISVANA